jgi:carbon-monoxide dehydrogenase medium subunit
LKPATFDYVTARTVEEAVSHLVAAGGEGKILAGGQSLVPAMNFRLARPAVLVDINGVAELSKITADGDTVTIGSMVRHVDLERNSLDGPLGRLFAEVARWVGHVPIRTRGTIGGSLAHADPAAEWGVVAVTLDATLEVVGPGGIRRIAAADLFRSVFLTSLDPDEVITAISFQVLGSDVRFGFREFARRSGDFALVSVLAVASMASRREVATARIGLGGVGATPLRATPAESILSGREVDERVLREAAASAAGAVEPPADVHASSEFRRKLVRNLTIEALSRATRID